MILSVPHSGTRFLMERLGDGNHAHTTWPWEKVWKSIEAFPEPIVPLRDPAQVWRSWCRRCKPESFPYGEFFLAWGQLHAIDQMMELDVICVDKKEDPRITDWSTVGSGDGNHANWKLVKCDLRSLYELPIVKRHYGPLDQQVPFNAYNRKDRENRIIANG